MLQKREKPIFIVGSGRCGSTLLVSLLNSTERVFIPPESHFIQFANYFKTIKESDYNLLADLFVHSSQGLWGLGKTEICSELTRNRVTEYSDVMQSVMSLYLKKNKIDVETWGIKRPYLITSIPLIKRVFPGAKIVHLVRDGRDVYVSFHKTHETNKKIGPKALLTSALYWVDAVRRIDRVRQEDILEIKYEDMVTDVNSVVDKLQEYLQMEIPIKANQSGKYDRLLVSDKQKEALHENIGKGIMKDNFSKYNKEMTHKQQALYEFLAFPYLRKYNYDTYHLKADAHAAKMIRAVIYKMVKIFNNLRISARNHKVYMKYYIENCM